MNENKKKAEIAKLERRKKHKRFIFCEKLNKKKHFEMQILRLNNDESTELNHLPSATRRKMIMICVVFYGFRHRVEEHTMLCWFANNCK